ncbi:calcium/sodium antiporter [Jannaschia aquimarina]|uniref:YrbG_2 protein n=1 Tax=Jannaschia aquimarina TaxID=935700 RepID=A0A0D1CRJ6_9RHOB|nr:calcium/sodium antiporter [Jannaschia aquimarina]KIT17392.1 Inner membrane protein YrbG [Jannaschia aquimarina]SNT24564.1 cation:H+ antiporter [Jannaschia aquimarina]
MIIEFASVAVGLLILIFAGDALVKGAVNLALRLGLPALVVSLTVVAFGTSAPELLVSVQAVIDGVPGLALGNVVGSNTANVLLVLGVPALIATLHTSNCETRKDYAYMVVASLIFIALCFSGSLVWWNGLILLSVLVAILLATFLSSRGAEDEVEGADDSLPGWKLTTFLVLGLIGLPLGASLLVDGASEIARAFGVTETVIGLTLVAIGTSLPELATTVMAAIRRHADVALGNVIGSNLFNLTAIVGITVLVGPIPVEESFLRLDLWIMLGATALLIPFVFLRQDITRLWGIGLFAIYVAYLVLVLV